MKSFTLVNIIDNCEGDAPMTDSEGNATILLVEDHDDLAASIGDYLEACRLRDGLCRRRRHRLEFA
jgi:hypothetical protein